MSLRETIIQLCGLNFQTRSKFFKFSIILAHTLFIALNLKFQYYYHTSLFGHPDLLGCITSLSEMLMPILLHTTLIIESFVRTKRDESIQKISNEIQTYLQSDPLTFPMKKFFFLFLLNSTLFMVVAYLVSDSSGEAHKTIK
jgi:hypothetical protein